MTIKTFEIKPTSLSTFTLSFVGLNHWRIGHYITVHRTWKQQ